MTGCIRGCRDILSSLSLQISSEGSYSFQEQFQRYIRNLFWYYVFSPGCWQSDCNCDWPPVSAGCLPISATADDTGL